MISKQIMNPVDHECGFTRSAGARTKHEFFGLTASVRSVGQLAL